MAVGQLLYGSVPPMEFDDRTLAHIQLVIGMKLRRHESFFFSWRNGLEEGSGRTSLWLEPSIPLMFQYTSNRMPTINRAWLDALTLSSNSAQGLALTDEPALLPIQPDIPAGGSQARPVRVQREEISQ